MKRIGCALAASLMLLAGCGRKNQEGSREPSEVPSQAPIGEEGTTTPGGEEGEQPEGSGAPQGAAPGEPGGTTGSAQGGAATPGAPGTTGQTPSMTDEEVVRRLGDLINAFNKRDRERASAYYTESTVTRMLGYEREWTGGRENIERVFQSEIWQAFPDLQIMPELVLVDGMDAIVVLHATGTNDGPIMGQKATKKKIGIHALWHVRLTPEGKIDRQQIVFDPVTVLAQLELSPLPAREADLDGWPTDERKIVIGADSAEEQANVALVKQLEMVVDPKQPLAYVSEEIIVHDMAMPSDVKGKKAVNKKMAEWSKSFSQPKVLRSEYFVAGEYVVAVVEKEAVNTGNVPALKAKKTGKPVKQTAYIVARVADDQIVEMWSFGNALELLEQMNISPTTGKQQPQAGRPAKPAGKRAAR